MQSIELLLDRVEAEFKVVVGIGEGGLVLCDAEHRFLKAVGGLGAGVVFGHGEGGRSDQNDRGCCLEFKTKTISKNKKQEFYKSTEISFFLLPLFMALCAF